MVVALPKKSNATKKPEALNARLAAEDADDDDSAAAVVDKERPRRVVVVLGDRKLLGIES